MATYFLDSSAVVKRYIFEQNPNAYLQTCTTSPAPLPTCEHFYSSPIPISLCRGAKLSREQDESISETATFVKHYFVEGELATWFAVLETVLYEEIMKFDDLHGEPHYYGITRLISRKLTA